MQRIIFYGAKGTRLTLPGFLGKKNALRKLASSEPVKRSDNF